MEKIFNREGSHTRRNVWFWVRGSILITLLMGIATGPLNCGGCMLCGADVNIDTSGKTGQISVVMQGFSTPSGDNPTAYVSVSYEGSCTQAQGKLGRTSFHISRTYEITSSGNVNPAPQHSRRGLKPGIWSVTARSGNWSATGIGKVGEAKTTTFVFRLNSSNVSVQ